MKTVRIVPSKSPENGLTLSQGTRFYADDQEIHGVESADVHFAVDDIVRATIRMHISMDDVEAQATFMATNPNTGKWQEVRRIEFEDGSVFDADRLIDVTSLSSTAREKQKIK